MRFDLDSLGPDPLAPAPHATGGGQPLMLAVDSIDEDPEQPRTESIHSSLQEMADSVSGRGVLQPVSVRRHPHTPGRWMLNFGARRLRAARMAGLTEIPAFVKEGADVYDQVVENEQREGLRPFELARFIQQRQAAGEKSVEIAKKLGKSRAFVASLSALIDPPEWLMEIYRTGRCTTPSDLYELRTLVERCPAALDNIIADGDALTRRRIRELASKDMQKRIATAGSGPNVAAGGVESRTVPGEESDGAPAPMRSASQRAVPSRRAPRLCVIVDFRGEQATLVIDSPPAREGYFFVSLKGSEAPLEAASSELRLLRIERVE